MWTCHTGKVNPCPSCGHVAQTGHDHREEDEVLAEEDLANWAAGEEVVRDDQTCVNRLPWSDADAQTIPHPFDERNRQWFDWCESRDAISKPGDNSEDSDHDNGNKSKR